MASSGIQKDQLVISKEAINALIKWYCRESGVRNLQKHIEKVCVCVFVCLCVCMHMSVRKKYFIAVILIEVLKFLWDHFFSFLI